MKPNNAAACVVVEASHWVALCLSFLVLLTYAPLGLADPVSVDLSSTNPSIISTVGANQRTVINVGGVVKSVGSGQSLTPAEQVALNQVINSGRQNLVIGVNGNAIGGTLNLINDVRGSASTVVIPQGVTALRNVATSPGMDIAGNLTNAGSFYLFTTNSAVQTATINAVNISNLQGGLISTVLPSNNILGVLNAAAALNLAFNAVGKITNAGTITSSGNLTMTAGTSIVNSLGLSIAAASSAINCPTVQAAGNINVLAPIVTNNGLIQSLNNNINVGALTAGDLILNSQGGVTRALEGVINVSNTAALAANKTSLLGGDFFSRELNISGGEGWINGEVGDVTGVVNLKACNASFGAEAKNLHLGNLDIYGDPTYFNKIGSLTLNNIANTNGANLALVASGDVIVTGGTIDTTRPSGGSAGTVTIVAGANFTTNGAISGSNNTNTTVTITQSSLPGHGSVTGGAIDLSLTSGIWANGSLNLDIGAANGGAVTLVAFGGSGAGNGRVPGTINLGTNCTINSFGSGTGANGNVNVIAGASANMSSGAAIEIPGIYSGASPTYNQLATGGGGNVTITTAIPDITGSLSILNGTVISGLGVLKPSVTLQPTSIYVGEMSGVNVNIHSSVTNWQDNAVIFAINTINNVRAGLGLAPLILHPSLNKVAQDYANYSAANGHYEHPDGLGIDPFARREYYGINLPDGMENLGVGKGTPRSAFVYINDEMMAEPDNQMNHRYALTHNTYVGIGIANLGNTFFVVEEFSDSNPTPNGANTIATTPIAGGLSGTAGYLATGAEAGGLQVPTSMVTGGANVTVKSGGSLQIDGVVRADGLAGFASLTAPFPGRPGGIIDISAVNNILMFSAQSSGGRGNDVYFGAGGMGGKGGTINITSETGNVTISPYGLCYCISAGAAGGAGGQAAQYDVAGGSGGAGGSINMLAPLGNIYIIAADASGGGGSGGAGGFIGGAGGNGGAAGKISLNAGGSVTVVGYLAATGGGGGGAGGWDSFYGSGGGGGGGGTMGLAGRGGYGGMELDAGGGGGGGAVPGLGGGIDQMHGSSGLNGDATNPSYAGVWGGFGGGGTGGMGGIGYNGGAGGAMAQAGSRDSSGLNAGGAAGAGGTIDVSGNSLVFSHNVSWFWSPYGPFLNGSDVLNALGSGGKVTLALGSGSLSLGAGSRLADAPSVVINTSGGAFGSDVASVPIRTANLTVNGAGSAGISNTIPTGLTSLILGSSKIGGAFSLTNSGSISVNGTLHAAGITLIAGGSAGSILFNANVSALNASGLTLTAAGTGTLSQAINTTIEAGKLSVSSGTGNISLGLGAPASGTLNVTGLTIPSSSGSVSIVNGRAVSLGAINMLGSGHTLNLTALPGITTTAAVSLGGGGTFTTASFTNSQAVSASSGSILLQGAPGAPLIVSGGGSVGAAGGITVTSTGSFLQFAGNQTFNNSTVLNCTTGSVAVKSGVTVTVSSGTLTINTTSLFNAAGFSPAPIVNLIGTSTIGTIANPTGDVVLPAGMLINTFGKSLVLLASGNIIAKNLPSINLSSGTGPGGSFVALAGFNFTGTPIGTIDKTTLFTITDSSVTGGSINLSGTAINTASFSGLPTGYGGNIILMANAGSVNNGTVLTGAINSSSTGGNGGTVSVIGAGGIIVNGLVSTTGLRGSGDIMMSASSLVASGSLLVRDGLLAPGTIFTAGAPTAGSGAAVAVNGAINTNSMLGKGGNVRLISESQMFVGGKIYTAGMPGGFVDLSSLNGSVGVNGSINTAGASISNQFSSATAGSGGAITIAAPFFISVAGALTSAGGTTLGTGNGGAGGAVSLATSSTTVNAQTIYRGDVYIAQFINSAGGNAIKTGVGGAGGAVDARGATVRVTGITFANGASGSIIASGGSGLGGVGAHGTVFLNTSAVQSLPGNLNLTSKIASEFAIPGGTINIGVGPVVNGTMGSIVSGNSIANVANAANLSPGSQIAFGSKITIVVTGEASVSFTENSLVRTINAGGARIKITPAEAAALYQTTYGGALSAQQIGLNEFGQATSQDPQNIANFSSINTSGPELPNFKAFVLAAAGVNASGIVLNITGATPTLNLTNALTQSIAGQLNFVTPGNVALVNSGFTLLKVLNGAQLTSAGTLILQASSPISNAGTVSGSSLIVLNPRGAFSLTNTGTITAPSVIVPSNGLPLNLVLTNNQGTMPALISFSSIGFPSRFGAITANLAPSANVAPAASISLTMAGPGNVTQTAQIGGSLANISSLKVTTGSTQAGSVSTNLSIAAGTNIRATQSLLIQASGSLAISSASLQSGGGLAINSRGAVISSSSLSGLTALVISSAGITTSGATELSAMSGSVIINAPSSAVTFGGGTSINSKLSTIISGAALSFSGTIGNDVQLASTGSTLLTGTGGVQTAFTNITSTARISISGGTGAFADAGQTSMVTNGVVSIIANSVGLGAGSTIFSSGPSLVSLTAIGVAGTVSISANSGSPTAISGSTVVINSSGALSFASAQVTAVSSTLSIKALSGNFTDTGGSLFKSNASSVSLAGKALIIGLSSASTVTAMTGISINASATTVTLGSGSNLSTLAGNLGLNGKTGVSIDANLSAGSLQAGAPSTGVVLNNQIATSGSIIIKSGLGSSAPGTVTLGTGRSLIANGTAGTPGQINIVANGGSINLGASNVFNANGGNIVILATNQVSGSSGNQFIARGVATSNLAGASNSGGNIEIGAGTIVSQLPSALLKPAGTTVAPGTLGAAVTINNPTNGQNSTGVVMANGIASGSINLSNSNSAVLNLTSGGAIVIDALTSGSSVVLDGAIFTVSSYRAVSHRTQPATSFAIDESVNGDQCNTSTAAEAQAPARAAETAEGTESAESTRTCGGVTRSRMIDVARIISPGVTQSQMVSIRDARTKSNGGEIELLILSGELFVHPAKAAKFCLPAGAVHAKKDSMLLVSAEPGVTRVAVCSGPGDVIFATGDTTVNVHPGEELVISDHALARSEHFKGDGIGRRNAHSWELADGHFVAISELSLTSMVANAKSLQAVRYPVSLVERRICERILKLEAARYTVSQSRGRFEAYLDSPATNLKALPPSFKAVGYSP